MADYMGIPPSVLETQNHHIVLISELEAGEWFPSKGSQKHNLAIS